MPSYVTLLGAAFAGVAYDSDIDSASNAAKAMRDVRRVAERTDTSPLVRFSFISGSLCMPVGMMLHRAYLHFLEMSASNILQLAYYVARICT